MFLLHRDGSWSWWACVNEPIVQVTEPNFSKSHQKLVRVYSEVDGGLMMKGCAITQSLLLRTKLNSNINAKRVYCFVFEAIENRHRGAFHRCTHAFTT